MASDQPGRRGRARNPLHGDGPRIDLARALREVVDRTRLTDNQFGQKHHLSASAVSKALSGKHTPTWDTTWTIASTEPDADRVHWQQRWTEATTGTSDHIDDHIDDRQQDPAGADRVPRRRGKRLASPAERELLGRASPHPARAGWGLQAVGVALAVAGVLCLLYLSSHDGELTNPVVPVVFGCIGGAGAVVTVNIADRRSRLRSSEQARRDTTPPTDDPPPTAPSSTTDHSNDHSTTGPAARFEEDARRRSSPVGPGLPKLTRSAR